MPDLKTFASLIKELDYKKIKVLEKKNQVSIDYQSSREDTYNCIGCVPIIFAPGFLAGAYKVYYHPDIEPIFAQGLGGIGLVLLVIGYYLLFVAKSPSDRFLLDFDSQELIDLRKKGGEATRRTLCTFQDMDTLVLHTVYSYQKGAGGWYHGLSLLTKKGSLFELKDRRSNDRALAEKLGLGLAKLLNLELQQGEEGTIFQYKEAPNGIEYEFVPFEPKTD